MHNNGIKIAIMLMLTASINAYEFSFFNKTKDPIAIAIQFADGENEPLYKEYIKPGTMVNLVPGRRDIPDIKWSFCLHDYVYYIKNPTMKQRAHNFAKAVWNKVPITWTPLPLETAKKPKLRPIVRAKKTDELARHLVMKKHPIKAEEKSLCKDRHFEITQDQHGKVIVTGSLVEKALTVDLGNHPPFI